MMVAIVTAKCTSRSCCLMEPAEKENTQRLTMYTGSAISMKKYI